MRYEISDSKSFRGGRGEDVRVLNVKYGDTPWGPLSTHVWVTTNYVKCCKCSTPLVAMSESCPHARAVKRWLKRESAHAR